MSFVAITKVRYPHDIQDQIHAFGLKILPIARQQPGFIAIRFHESLDASETLMYWEWESVPDHEAFMVTPAWESLMAHAKPLFETEGVEFSSERYERLA